jgi:Uma2 family endonuclease
MQPAFKQTLYEQLEALPEGLTGEILKGQLHTQPRPTAPHLRVESTLGSKVHRRYDEGDGGPGGWWILVEPELHFVRDTEVLVPDIAGWRRERMPSLPDGHRFEVVPDWVCEIPSPSTESKDREIKMPTYAHYGVAHAWLVHLGGQNDLVELGRIRLVVGADLDPDDVRAVVDQDDRKLLAEELIKQLGQPGEWPEAVENGLGLLRWMVEHGYREIRVALRRHRETGEPLPFASWEDG